MRPALLPLASGAILAGILATDFALQRGFSRDASQLHVEPLLEAARRDRPVAALTLLHPTLGELFYVRAGGRWRCASAYGAPVDPVAVRDLVGELATCRGAPRPGANVEAADALTITLHGPGVMKQDDKDALLTLELGASLPGGPRGRAFAARAGAPEVFEIDTDPRRWLDDSSSLPPLLDDRLLAGVWDRAPLDFQRVFVDRPGGASLELVQVRPGAWTLLEEGAQPADVMPYRIAGYLRFLLRERYRGLAPPDRREEFVSAASAVRVTLVPDEGAPVELSVGPSFVWNDGSRLLLQLDSDSTRLMTPDRAMLTDDSIENPWERYLGG